jgi:hypothetical protein
MSTNDRVLLDGILSSRRASIAPEMAEDKFFELFLAEQLLWAKNLSWEELLDGVIGGGGDGGIDAVYIFYNGILLTSDDLPPESRGTASFELFVIQAKRTAGFSETTVDKLRNSLSDLLNFDRALDDMDEYSQELTSIIGRFRDSYVANASKFPTVTLRVFYGSRGFEIHPNVQRKAANLRKALVKLFSGATCEFIFVTPSELIKLARRQRPTTLDLRFQEVMTTSAGGWIALVELDAYSNFVSTEDGGLLNAIFDSNVRDYESNAKINASIRATLNDGEGDDFWWLNNGVTIVATRAGQSGKILTLEYPQVVNGLQTTREIYRYISQRDPGNNRPANDTRTVLVRIVVPPTDASRDRIIRATNSQTPIPSVALRATDKIQRDIEEYFLQNGYFYERRKNHYQNEGKPIARIVTIPYLAEAVLAVILHEPHLGPPRFGGGFLRDDDTYSRIFDPAIPLREFLQSVQLTQKIEHRFRNKTDAAREALPSTADRHERRRLRRSSERYMLPTTMAVAIVSGPLDALNVDDVSTETIDACEGLCMRVDSSSDRHERKGPGGSDVRFANLLI